MGFRFLHEDQPVKALLVNDNASIANKKVIRTQKAVAQAQRAPQLSGFLVLFRLDLNNRELSYFIEIDVESHSFSLRKSSESYPPISASLNYRVFSAFLYGL